MLSRRCQLLRNWRAALGWGGLLGRHGLSLPTHALALPAFSGLGIAAPGDWVVLPDGDNRFSSAVLSGKRRAVEEPELSGSWVATRPGSTVALVANESTNQHFK